MAKKPPAEDKILKDLGQYQITGDTPRFSELEERILALHDELEELRVERTLLECSLQTTKEPDLMGDELEQAIKQAEIQALEARAGYKLRNSIVGNVLLVDPILKAVHLENSTSATPSLQELKRLLAQRDVLTLTQTNMATQIHDLKTELSQTQVRTIKAVATNRELASQVYELAGSLQEKGPETVQDQDLQDRLAESNRSLEQAKQTRALLKSVVSGIVAGSGIDWSQDESLRALVLDEDQCT